MSEHYPESAIGEEVLSHCNRCRRLTRHRIERHSEHSGRAGACLEHEPQPFTKKQLARREQQERDEKAPRLFR